MRSDDSPACFALSLPSSNLISPTVPQAGIPLSLMVAPIMVGDSLGQPLHNGNDDLFETPLSHRTSIQNSPDWPSVKSLSPYPSIRTLNGPDDGEDSSEDILSLADFSIADSDRSSVLTVRLTSPINSRSSTPRAREHMHSNSLKQGEL